MTSDGEGPFQGEAGEAVGVRWESVRQVIRSDQRGALVTVIDGQDVGAKLLVTATATEGSLSDAALDAEATATARELLPDEESAVREIAGRQLFFDVFAPQPKLLIVGAVDFAAALARVASQTGYRVIVVDARERFATRDRIPDADVVVLYWSHEHLALHSLPACRSGAAGGLAV